jgi:hypothetical protein
MKIDSNSVELASPTCFMLRASLMSGISCLAIVARDYPLFSMSHHSASFKVSPGALSYQRTHTFVLANVPRETPTFQAGTFVKGELPGLTEKS